MAIEQYDLELKSGATFHLPCMYLTAPDNLGVRESALPAGWAVKVQFRKHPNDVTTLFEQLPAIDNATGAFDVLLTGAEVEALPSLCWWGMKAYAAGGEPSVDLVEGKVTVSLAVVR